LVKQKHQINFKCPLNQWCVVTTIYEIKTMWTH